MQVLGRERSNYKTPTSFLPLSSSFPELLNIQGSPVGLKDLKSSCAETQAPVQTGPLKKNRSAKSLPVSQDKPRLDGTNP